MVVDGETKVDIGIDIAMQPIYSFNANTIMVGTDYQACQEK